ncbi:Ectonucleotide pyrophosphatase/phosphodiesterase C27A7.1 [Trichinella spiralis]|uniref:Ectonucleotide pyrophosphatase/phosphodiesterase C27A7.1 n=1 Tax=Trichinella spiralis TaxID=6334 RepID=A0ABR3KMH2_TRISP
MPTLAASKQKTDGCLQAHHREINQLTKTGCSLQKITPLQRPPLLNECTAPLEMMRSATITHNWQMSRTKWLLVCLAILIPLALLIALICVATSRKSQSPEVADRWHSDVCNRKRICPKHWDLPVVLMVSLDGFRADYLKRNKTNAMQKLIECGSTSPFMYASYPSKTFPNHYTIVTGLYPESHGIIDNRMLDKTISPIAEEQLFTMKHSDNPKWWLGEPIWNTVMKNGMKAAPFNWPGSDKYIQNMNGTYAEKYNSSLPFANRIDKVIKWLQLPDDQRPSLINVYFNQPDEDGHTYGPDSEALSDTLLFVDSVINYLFTELKTHDLIDCVNVIILADHGMQKMIPEEVSVQKYFNGEENMNGIEVFSGPVARIMILNSSISVQTAENLLQCQPEFRVYNRMDVPKRLHFSSSNRIGDLVLDGNAGIQIWKTNKSWEVVGDHGFDFRIPTMHTLFVSTGPSIKEGYVVQEPFKNVEIYNLVADLLQLKSRASTNGTLGALHEIQINPPELDPPAVKQVPKCKYNVANASRCSLCTNIKLPSENCAANYRVNVCSESKENLCWIDGCGFTLWRDNNMHYTSMIETRITAKMQTASNAHTICTVISLENSLTCSQEETIESMLHEAGISLYPILPFVTDSAQKSTSDFLLPVLYSAKSAMYQTFYDGIWNFVLSKTLEYSKQYGDLVAISGPIFDYDHDGLADHEELIDKHKIHSTVIPTHYYLILLRCDQPWRDDNVCDGNSEVMSFAIPHRKQIQNCQTSEEYMYTHTATVHDIELLTGLRFFDNWEFSKAQNHRRHINQQLWS